jgi:hypothetical protein
LCHSDAATVCFALKAEDEMERPICLITLLKLVANAGYPAHLLHWELTPMAWQTCCIMPDGAGGFLGDHMRSTSPNPRLLGISLRIVQGDKPGDCSARLALTEGERKGLESSFLSQRAFQ